MTEEEKQEAAKNLWEEDTESLSPYRKILTEKIAEVKRFRVKTVRAYPVEKKVKATLLLARGPARIYHQGLIRAWLCGSKRPLMQAVLDGASIPNNEGFIEEDLPESPTAEAFAKGIKKALATNPARQVAIYIFWLIADSEADDSTWKNLAEGVAATSLSAEALAPSYEGEGKAEAPEENDDDSPEGESVQEDSTDFTTLDNFLIPALVAAALGTEGALNEDQAADLVDEIIDLNEKRQRTYFHRGFFHALFGRPFQFTFPGANEERRIWYLTGVLMGLLRQQDTDRLLTIIAEEKTLFGLLVSNRRVTCGSTLLPHLYPLLLDGDDLETLGPLATGHVGHCSPRVAYSLWKAIFEMGCEFLDVGNTGRAMACFELANAVLSKAKANWPREVVRSGLMMTVRRMAQTRQAEGDFAAASEMFQQALEKGDFDEAPNALCDLGLIKGGFRTLLSAMPSSEESACRAIIESLTAGKEHFEAAVARHKRKATNAHFCLGILALFEEPRNSSASIDHLRQATAALEKAGRMDSSQLSDWAHFLLAVALLEEAREADYRYAADLAQRSIESPLRFPLHLWSRALEGAALHEDQTTATAIASHLLAIRKSAFDIIVATRVFHTNKTLREKYVKWLVDREASPEQSWNDLAGILPETVRDGQLDLVGSILDRLEGIAVEHASYRERFRDLLSDPSSYNPGWDEEDAEWALVRILELEGRHLDAANRLRSQFMKLHHTGKRREAGSVLESVQSYALPEDEFPTDDLERLLKASEETPEDSSILTRLEDGEPVSIVYIGGNETQAQYEKGIREELAAHWPGLTLSFYFPGWTSNWIKELERARPAIDASQGVVLNKLVRTNFGRHVRRICDGEKAWTPCTGRGKASLIASIRDAAINAISQRETPWTPQQVG